MKILRHNGSKFRATLVIYCYKIDNYIQSQNFLCQNLFFQLFLSTMSYEKNLIFFFLWNVADCTQYLALSLLVSYLYLASNDIRMLSSFFPTVIVKLFDLVSFSSMLFQNNLVHLRFTFYSIIKLEIPTILTMNIREN